MQTSISLTKTMAKLPQLELDETLITIMLLSEQSIVAVASDLLDDEVDHAQDASFCHIVRIDDAWAEA